VLTSWKKKDLKLQIEVIYLYLLYAFALRNHASSKIGSWRVTFSEGTALQMSELQRHNSRAFHSVCSLAPSHTVFPPYGSLQIVLFACSLSAEVTVWMDSVVNWAESQIDNLKSTWDSNPSRLLEMSQTTVALSNSWAVASMLALTLLVQRNGQFVAASSFWTCLLFWWTSNQVLENDPKVIGKEQRSPPQVNNRISRENFSSFLRRKELFDVAYPLFCI